MSLIFEYLPGPLVENEKQLIVALSNFSINSYKDNIARINEEWNQYQSKETINKIVELVERILGDFVKSKVRTEYIGGLPVDVLTHQEIMDDLESYLKAKEKMIVTSVNPQISLLAFEHPEVKLYLKRATHRIADGIGVVKASKLMGGSIRERVTGIDVMDNF